MIFNQDLAGLLRSIVARSCLAELSDEQLQRLYWMIKTKVTVDKAIHTIQWEWNACVSHQQASLVKPIQHFITNADKAYASIRRKQDRKVVTTTEVALPTGADQTETSENASPVETPTVKVVSQKSTKSFSPKDRDKAKEDYDPLFDLLQVIDIQKQRLTMIIERERQEELILKESDQVVNSLKGLIGDYIKHAGAMGLINVSSGPGAVNVNLQRTHVFLQKNLSDLGAVGKLLQDFTSELDRLDIPETPSKVIDVAPKTHGKARK